MENYSIRNKTAWEYNAYDFWTAHCGTPEERAAEDMENPVGKLKKYAKYFVAGLKEYVKSDAVISSYRKHMRLLRKKGNPPGTAGSKGHRL